MALYTPTTPSARRARRNRTATSIRCRRAHFARQATIDAFEWRYAKTLDQANFVDRLPGDLPPLAPGDTQMTGVIVLDGRSP